MEEGNNVISRKGKMTKWKKNSLRGLSDNILCTVFSPVLHFVTSLLLLCLDLVSFRVSFLRPNQKVFFFQITKKKLVSCFLPIKKLEL